jgi:UDP-N-acetylmuramoyl-L-alanyl-D-glutamate--2,6-diaminopimelate ligase
MRLSTLLNGMTSLPAQADRAISGLGLDSRKMKPNNLFLAVKGTQLEGRKYIPDAIARGAIAVLVEADEQENVISIQQNVPLIPVYQLQEKLGHLGARFYDYPAKKLRMIGVTGTSGKTSCVHFIAQILQSLSIKCGMIGTLGSGFYGALTETGLTTPDAITLQAILHEMRHQGAKAVAMEVSSHSIDQGRVNEIEFEMGIFSNLTQDHLDYHGDMETYAGVKYRFLAEPTTKQVIINADDPHGRKWIAELSARKSVFAYGTSKPALPAHVPCIYSEHAELSLQGVKAQVYTPWGDSKLDVPLVGQFNLSNVLAVLTALCVYGIPFSDVIARLSQLKAVPGRMQSLGGNDKPLIIVDYAHKPDALEKALQALRAHTNGKLICVFGCGGERDHGKRPLMAKIAEQWADRVIVTNDNPRHEKPEAIAEQILQGFSHPDRVTVTLDRSKAIENSIQWASAKDCILIAGKGAERYQQIGDEKMPFDDVEKVTDYLTKLPS